MLTTIKNFCKAWAITIIGWLIILISFLTTSHAVGQEMKLLPDSPKQVCSVPPPPTITLKIPKPPMNRAIKKTQLIALLKKSLEDDSESKLDPHREKELKDLAKQLSK